MKFGIDRLIAEDELRKPLQNQRVSLIAHPASVTASLDHSLDALIDRGVNVTSAFGPQHGLKGDKQDNMVETADETDPQYGIPVLPKFFVLTMPMKTRLPFPKEILSAVYYLLKVTTFQKLATVF